MVVLNTITDEWFNKMMKIKAKYPDNRLLKHLISTAWGTLNASNIDMKTYDEIEELTQKGVTIGLSKQNDFMIIDNKKYINNGKEKELYTLLDTKHPYKFNIRLKSWITAHRRNLLGETALKVGLDKVIRLHTDNLCLTEPFDFQDKNFIPEDKTTGLIKWKNVNAYKKKDKK